MSNFTVTEENYMEYKLVMGASGITDWSSPILDELEDSVVIKNPLRIPPPVRLSRKDSVSYVFENKAGHTYFQIRNILQRIAYESYRKGLKGGVELLILNHKGFDTLPPFYLTKLGHKVDSRSTFFEYEISKIIGDYDDIKQNKYKKFLIYRLGGTFEDGGGADEFNRCFYNRMKEAIPKSSLPWKTPEEFEKAFNLKKGEYVPVTLIPQIEKKLKNFRFEVRGHATYVSPKQANKTIRLLLYNEHYQFDEEKSVKTYSNKLIFFKEERIPLLYQRDKRYDIVYDPESNKLIKGIDLISRIWKNQPIKHLALENKCYITIPVDKTNKPDPITKKKKDLPTLYKEFVKNADELKELTNGELNLYKTGSYKTTAQYLFFKFYNGPKPEPLSQNEAVWYDRCRTGPLTFCIPYDGEGYDYDIISAYPSIMISNISLPVKAGEFVKLKTLPDILNVGIYRCKITNNKNINGKLFKHSYYNEYTQIELNYYREHNLKIELIQDDQPNALIYTRDKYIKGTEMFKKFVDFMYPLKQKNKLAKIILDCLWGVLTSNDYKKKIYRELKPGEQATETEPFDTTLCNIRPFSENEHIVEYVDNQHIFKTEFARIKPFILSAARVKLSRIIEPFIDDVVYCHTDGFVTKHEQNVKLGDKIGDLKFKGYTENCKVTKINKKVEGF